MIGHSTFILFGKDANFVIDHVLYKRCSPFQWVGPERFRPLPYTFQDMPKIDVLVSHDHFDHLDDNALQKLYDKNNECYFLKVVKFMKWIGLKLM